MPLTLPGSGRGVCGCGRSRTRMDGQNDDQEMGRRFRDGPCRGDCRVDRSPCRVARRVRSAVPQPVWMVSGGVVALDVSRSPHACAAANASNSSTVPEMVVPQRLQAASKRSPAGESPPKRSPRPGTLAGWSATRPHGFRPHDQAHAEQTPQYLGARSPSLFAAPQWHRAQVRPPPGPGRTSLRRRVAVRLARPARRWRRYPSRTQIPQTPSTQPVVVTGHQTLGRRNSRRRRLRRHSRRLRSRRRRSRLTLPRNRFSRPRPDAFRGVVAALRQQPLRHAGLL
jgi:hypothetical protein